MKTMIISNFRPLCRAVCTTLGVMVALWAMPRRVDAQIYVFEIGPGVVDEYDAATGAAINANLITGLCFQSNAVALFGNDLFVSNATLNTIGEYNATTGAVINANFIMGLNPISLGRLFQCE
jgi:hypothetical protein